MVSSGREEWRQPSAQARHFGVDPGFINEHDLVDLLGMGKQLG